MTNPVSAPSPVNAHIDSRRAILDRLETWSVPAPSLPDRGVGPWTEYADPVAKFETMLAAVGGQSHHVEQPADIATALGKLPEFADARRIASVVPEAVSGNLDGESLDDPHSLASLDWMVARGDFLVAENGAIWVEGRSLPHRVMLFIAQYLAIVVSRQKVVHHMHAAYAKIGTPSPGFGVFVAGPSKTADIEQSLVLGAHGCRTLHVFLTP